jgi:hypothetical protein
LIPLVNIPPPAAETVVFFQESSLSQCKLKQNHAWNSCRNCRNVITLDSPTASRILQVSKEQFDKILDMCKQGEEQGAKLECGGKRLGDKGYYIEPTVFSNVQDDNIIATDEIFGPVQSILKWKTVEEVMAQKNNITLKTK